MATKQPFDGEPTPEESAVSPDGLHRVFRAARRKPAARQMPEQKQFSRRDEPSIKPDSNNQNALCRVHSLVSFNNPAFRSVVKKKTSE
jgi:hypothetical protein